MKRPLLMVLAAVFICTCIFQAQTQTPMQTPPADPMSTEAKNAYNSVKNYLLKAAEKMPEENYAFKPTPEMRSFGELLAHISDAQTGTCSMVNGAPKKGDAASKKTKAELVAAIQASCAECDTAFSSLTDATAAQMIKTGRGQRSKLGALVGVTTHDNESYGYMSVYFRLKGLVPPSSEK
ncbi:MAG: DinB family protein [Acidobacteriia bacterium]|nr:DinB family protein [Terriglobia bacterium]